MQIRGPSGEDGGEDGEEALAPFLTPQHQGRSPTQSFFSIQNSEDSLDVYHDAYSTLTRLPRLVGERKRHFSLGAGAIENGDDVETDCVEDSTETTGMLPKCPESRRVRHASCSTVTNRFKSAAFTGSIPCHIGRLSLSTNSLRKKMEHDSSDRVRKSGSTQKIGSFQKTGSTQKIGSLQKLGARVNGVVNYVPCAEMSQLVENSIISDPMSPLVENSIISDPVVREQYPEKSLSSETWLKNYVPSVETERMLGQSNGTGASSSPLEIRLCPGKIQQSEDTVLRMYSFRPVQRRQVGLHVRDEFKTENLLLHHRVPHLFVTSQWQKHNRLSCVYLGYRLFWALYFCMWAIWAWVGSMGYDADISQKKYFMLYMTNWGIWTLAIDTSLQAINTIVHFKKVSEEGNPTYSSMPTAFRVSWILSNITGSLHLFITLAYWITVYPYRSDEHLNEIGVNTHIMPGLYILIDAMVSATPRRLLHAYQPSLFLTVYVTFNLVYYLCGGTDYLGRPALYPVLDWTRPGMTIGVFTAVLFLAVPLLHSILCGLYAARLKVWRRLKISRYVCEDDEIDQAETPQEQKV